jgi:hypothetical protein
MRSSTDRDFIARQEGGPIGAPSESSSSAGDVGDDGDVARRAYRKFEERGYEHGHDAEDWYEAEREAREARRGTGDD